MQYFLGGHQVYFTSSNSFQGAIERTYLPLHWNFLLSRFLTILLGRNKLMLWGDCGAWLILILSTRWGIC